MKRTRAVVRHLLVVAASTMLALVASELILRVVLRDPVRTFPARVVARTTTAEYDVELATNGEGFRDVDHQRAKPEGVLRIAVIGDSFVVGSGVAFGAVFTSRLRDVLAEAGRNVEVFNFGVSGTGPVHGARVWRRFAARYRPDVVLVCLYAGNDASDALREASEKRAGPAILELARRARARMGAASGTGGAPAAANADSSGDWNAFGTRNPLEREALLESARARGVPAESVLARLQAIPDSLLADALAFRANPFNVAEAVLDPGSLRDNVLLESEASRRGWSCVERALRELQVDARRAGARMIVVCIPAGPQVDKRYWWAARLGLDLDQRVLTDAEFQHRLARLAASEGMEMIDLLPVMRAHADEALYYEQDGHWNAHGHEAAAYATAERMR